jgi:hypothetical protein
MPYSAAILDDLARCGDPVADSAVAELFAEGEVHSYNSVISLARSGPVDLKNLPEPVRVYFETTNRPPEWIDWDLIEKAQVFFSENAAYIDAALALASMPLGYAIPQLARTLSATHELDHPSRRLAETAGFQRALIHPDAFTSQGIFIPTVQKVRLMHATIRLKLGQRGWSDANRGELPINQRDLIAAQLGFSLVVLEAMDRMGVHVTEDGAAGYYHAWRVATAMLGCGDEAPADLDEARAYLDIYLPRHLGPTPEGIRLTRELIAYYEERLVPGVMLDSMVPSSIRLLLGDTIADWLEIPRSRWDVACRTLPWILDAFSTVEDNSALARWAFSRVQRMAGDFEAGALLRDRMLRYALPEELGGATVEMPQANSRWRPPAVALTD